MPFKVLDNISVTPTFAKMIGLRKQINANQISVDCPWERCKGQLGILQDPTNFAVWNGGPYDPPTQEPHMYPIIDSGTSTAN